MRALLLMIPVGLVVAGCGGRSARLSTGDYQKALTATLSRVERETNGAYAPTIQTPSSTPSVCVIQNGSMSCQAGAGVKLPTRAELVRAGARVRAVYDRAAKDFAALQPPTDAVKDNGALVAGLRLEGSLWDQVLRADPADPAIEKKEAKFRAIASSATANSFDRARADLERKGYKLGFLAMKPPPREQPATDCGGCTEPGVGEPHRSA